MTYLLLLLALPALPAIPAQTVSDHPDHPPSCTNTSTWGPVIWEDSKESCCITRIVEPDCTYSNERVCANLTETKCQIETWQECTMKDCPVQVTTPNHVTLPFTPWHCNDVWVNVTHHKKRPVEFINHKEECDEIWLMDDNGEKYSGGFENCHNVTWTDYRFEWYEVPVLTKQSECVKYPPIEYDTCKNTTTTSVQKCTDCVARALPKCETSVREDCRNVRVKTCKPQTVTDCDWKWKVPIQEFTHKKRCFGHNGETGEEEVGPRIQLRGNDEIFLEEEGGVKDRLDVWSR